MLIEERNEVIRRLRVSEGHLRAIIGMLESDQPYEQVLHQLRAVRAALRAASGCLLTFQIEQSQEILLLSTCPEDRKAELVKLQELFATLNGPQEFHGGMQYE